MHNMSIMNQKSASLFTEKSRKRLDRDLRSIFLIVYVLTKLARSFKVPEYMNKNAQYVNYESKSLHYSSGKKSRKKV